MKKNTQKSVKNQHFLTFFVLFLFFFINSCNFSTKTERFECKWSTDYENIADSALDSLDDMKRINIQQMKAACNF
jgi:YbbR domain-containing protein